MFLIFVSGLTFSKIRFIFSDGGEETIKYSGFLEAVYFAASSDINSSKQAVKTPSEVSYILFEHIVFSMTLHESFTPDSAIKLNTA